MDEKLYQIELVNERSIPVHVDENGRTLVTVKPGETVTIEAWDPSVMYAPFRKVIYRRDGSVETKPNPDWVSPLPDGAWTINLSNEDDTMHAVFINGQSVEIYPGIPRRVRVDLEDPSVWYKTISFLREQETIPHPRNKNYQTRRWAVRQKKTLRSKRDLRKIREQMAEVERQRADCAITGILPKDVSEAMQGEDDAAV